MSLDLASQEERIQSLADILSLVAMIGGMDKAAVQRVLISLGSSLLDVRTPLFVDRDLASRLLVRIAKESGDQAAIEVASDMAWVARSWRPVLEDQLQLIPADRHRVMPYAEVIFALVNYSGTTLHEYGAFDQFGGADMLLPMQQLSASLSPYPFPRTGLAWDLVGFRDPPDQALVASDEQNYYLFKTATSPIRLNISELERGGDEDARRDHDLRLDPPLFGAFVAGLLGDMLYWAARLRHHAAPGHEVWQRVITLLLPTTPAPQPARPIEAEPPV